MGENALLSGYLGNLDGVQKKLAYSDALILKTYYLATAKKFNNNNINNYQSCIVKIYKSWFDPIL